jgi:mitochondrial division protein 1
MSMDILWAISHPPKLHSRASHSHIPDIYTQASVGNFGVPMPPYADGSWEIYEDFVGGVQFWGHGLVSGSGDGAVRMWDSKNLSWHSNMNRLS